MKSTMLLAATLLATAVSHGDDRTHTIKAPPGAYRTSWVGNSFPGDGGPNGVGYWVQNGADEIEVTPDGTVLAGTDWDEAGRCVGLYKDGKVNRVLLKQEGPGVKETAWGWNTGNRALAVDGPNIFIANKGKRLLRFTWKPGVLDSAQFADERELSAEVVGLHARGGKLAVGYADRLELRNVSDSAVLRTVAVSGLKDVALAPDGTPWVIAGDAVGRLGTADTGAVASPCQGVAKPSAIAFGLDGRLIVCDDGPDQQVKFFDVTGERPRLAATFGERGGLRSGRPGESRPSKLYSPRGAGTDAAGNLYVALGFNGAPIGTLVLRSLDPRGTPRWELANHAFVDTYGFDPASDGCTIYGRTAILEIETDGTTSPPWRQRATTVDHVTFPADVRANSAMSVQLRHLEGRRLLYGIGQYGGGYHLFTFDGPDADLAKPAGTMTAEGETWAWQVAENGDIWHGDAPKRTIRRHAFLGWGAKSEPRFESAKPATWPWPEDFEQVRRVHYEGSSDTLYLSGYLKGESIDSWGVAGKTLRCIDGWAKGPKRVRWTAKLPVNVDGEGEGKPLSPCSLAFAGGYIFVGMTKPDSGRQHVHILAIEDARYVGSFVPGVEVGGNAGWQDMPYAMDAARRKDGEYLLLVEEDWRGKNLLYRWRPEGR
jgi:hypothetical protein